MLRREFFGSLTLLGAAFGITTLPVPDESTPKIGQPLPTRVDAASRALLLQTCAVAGFQYHHGEAVWNQLAPAQALTLVREPDNVHDSRAVRVEWCGRQLGYVPRGENAVVAGLLDRGEYLSAQIAAVERSDDPWQRVRLEIRVGV